MQSITSAESPKGEKRAGATYLKERLSDACSLRVLTSQLKTYSQKDETMIDVHGRCIVSCRELLYIYAVIVCIRLVMYGNNISIRGLSALSFSANRAMRRPGHVGWARTESPRFSFL